MSSPPFHPTTWSIAPAGLTVPQLIMKIPAFYEAWRLIITFTTAHQIFPFWARWIQFTPSYLCKICFNIIPPSMQVSSKLSIFLTVPSWSLCAFFLPHVCHIPCPPHLLGSITWIMFGKPLPNICHSVGCLVSTSKWLICQNFFSLYLSYISLHSNTMALALPDVGN